MKTQDDIYEKAKAVLIDKDGNPTPHYQSYLKYEAEWQIKVNAYNEEYTKAFSNPLKLQSWPIEGTMFHQDKDQAWNKWMALGYKNEIENAISILSTSPKDSAISELMQKIQNQRK